MSWKTSIYDAVGLTNRSHVYRTLNKVSFDNFDITGPQMVLTLKLTSFAWNVYDGRRPAEVGSFQVYYEDSLTFELGTGSRTIKRTSG